MTDKTIRKILSASEREELISDSDIEDFAEANRLKFDDVLCCLANHHEHLKPCWGCRYILNRCYRVSSGVPCSVCSRYVTTKDWFTSHKKRYRMQDDHYPIQEIGESNTMMEARDWKDLYFDVFNEDHTQKACGRIAVGRLITAMAMAFPEKEIDYFGDLKENRMNVEHVVATGREYLS